MISGTRNNGLQMRFPRSLQRQWLPDPMKKTKQKRHQLNNYLSVREFFKRFLEYIGNFFQIIHDFARYPAL
jgi:hypothetical protein